MKYISTRGQIEPVDFQDAVMMGLADDGGLIIPEAIPDVTVELDNWRESDYGELAMEILRLYAGDVPADDLGDLVRRTYRPDVFDGGVAPVVRAGDVHVMELWRGPTLSFKDVALQFLGNLFEYILDSRGGRMNILGATSGDTGSAAIFGVRGRRGIDIFIMFPRGRVSEIQQRQMTTVEEENVHCIAVEGSFDDCQRIMKTIAGDLPFKRQYCLGAVNSVNWARVLAQIVYYFRGAFAVRQAECAEKVRFCVPTGNFGDILAGWYAMQMGAPIEQLILATNENDILARFFNTGEYSLGEVVPTLSPAMDIQVASNFERYLYYRLGRDAERLRKMMADFASTGRLKVEKDDKGVVDESLVAGMGSKQDCLNTIGRYHREHNYLLDPHTAVGVTVAERFLDESVSPVVCLATAHPAKFPDAIKQATGSDIARHPDIEAIMDKPERCATLPNNPDTVKKFIIDAVD